MGFLKALALGIALSSLVLVGSHQVEHASPPIADPADHRFDGATEDFQKELVWGGFAAVGLFALLPDIAITTGR